MSSAVSRRIVFLSCAVVVCLGVPGSMAWERYDTASGAQNNCASCHPTFEGRGALHDLHVGNSQFTSECKHCHISQGDLPWTMYSGSTHGGYGCVGCHGRDYGETILEDYGIGLMGTPKMSGYGLRLRHFNKGVMSCSSDTCHGSPTAVTIQPESTDPPYYALGDVDITNACNTDGSEDTPDPELPPDPDPGNTLGLDNDGDGAIDGADPDCAPPGTPGEPGLFPLDPLLVSAHDPPAYSLDLTIGVPCSAPDLTLHYGPLAAVSSYDYSGVDCSIDNSGFHTWVFGSDSPSLFFLVVANDGTREGPYGKNTAGADRPPNLAFNTVCPMPQPQDLENRCD